MRKMGQNDQFIGRNSVRPSVPLSVRPFAAILGTGAIASAIGCMLVRRGWSVVLSHDPASPVLRRTSAFYDVLFGDSVCLDGVQGCYASTSLDIRRVLSADPDSLAVTPLDLMSLIVMGPLDLLVDARAEGDARPDLRHLARLSFGIGPGWYGGVNCGYAIPMPQPCARRGLRISAPESGYWYSAIEPGMRVYRHMALGKVGGATVRAPADGIILGILRDGLRLNKGVPLVDLALHLRAAPLPEPGIGARDIARETETLLSSYFPGTSRNGRVQNFLSAMPCLRSA